MKFKSQIVAIVALAALTACGVNQSDSASSVASVNKDMSPAVAASLAQVLTDCVQYTSTFKGTLKVVNQTTVVPTCSTKIVDTQTGNDNEQILIWAAGQAYRVIAVGPDGMDNDEWNIKIVNGSGQLVYARGGFVSDDSLIGVVARIAGVNIKEVSK